MTITKQQYLSDFRNNPNNESQLRFLARWCEEEKREFKSLLKLLDVVKLFKKTDTDFQQYMEKTLVRYLDVKYNVCILWSSNKEVILIY